MSREKKEAEYPPELETQFILRLPDEPAKALRDVLRTGENLKNRLTIQVDDDMRHGEVRFDHWLMHAKIVDLPTITESLKTIDNKSFYKTADVTQMMICKTEPDQSPVDEESPMKKKKDPYKVDKKFLWPHGLTPPTKNIRKRRFRKTLKKKCAEAPEIEKEVKRLLRADNEAASVTWEIITEDEILKQETFTPTHTLKSERKKKDRSVKIESSAVPGSSGSSNIIDIFGEVVSDSEGEDGDIHVEVEDIQLLPQEFVISMNTKEEKKEKKIKIKSEKKHRSKKNKDKKKSKKKHKNKHKSCTVTEIETCTVTETETSTVTQPAEASEEEQASEDEHDYQEHDSSKDNMNLKIEKVRAELEILKFRKQAAQTQMFNMKNDSEKERFQGDFVELNQNLMYKEMEYLGLVTLQNSDEI